MQATSGEVRVSAASAVFRRYCSVQDPLFPTLQRGAHGRTGLCQTGGEHVEMGQLATAIVSTVNPQSVATRPNRVDVGPNSYCSGNTTWPEWCTSASLRPADLREQIDQAAAVLLAS